MIINKGTAVLLKKGSTSDCYIGIVVESEGDILHIERAIRIWDLIGFPVLRENARNAVGEDEFNNAPFEKSQEYIHIARETIIDDWWTGEMPTGSEMLVSVRNFEYVQLLNTEEELKEIYV